MDQPMMPTYQTNNTFNPWSQLFTIQEPDGTTSFQATISDINILQQNAVFQSICQAIQLGAAFMLLVTLLIVTKTDKRRSLVFMLNSLALLFVVLRGIFSLLVFTGPFYDFYRWELGYYSNTGNAKAISATAEVMTLFLAIAIEMSLVLQVHIVCCNLEPFKRWAINLFNGFAAFAAVSLRFGLLVVNIKWSIAGVEQETEWQFERLNKLASATNIALVISIGISAVIFCAKLAFAIEARRSMGMTQFGPMQIIFVMGCQTMCTPLIFTIIAYWVVKNAQIGSFVPTAVAISLPLSAMWAAVTTNNFHIANPRGGKLRTIPVGGPDLASGKAYGDRKDHSGYSTNTTDTLVEDEAEVTPRKKTRFDVSETDLEMQQFAHGEGVQVDRSFSVRSN